jgi:two-component system nitrogen regulation sensor histidine kinase NtrY
MPRPEEESRFELLKRESKKRKREIFLTLLISLAVVGLFWFEVRLFSTSQQLPFFHSIFFFGLVNFNIILLLLLFFLIFRNVVKIFLERQGKILGSSLKAKLVAAFVSFATVPTILVFFISVFYVNASFDRWFNSKVVGVLKSSLEVQSAYYTNAKRRNYHFAKEVAEELRREKNPRRFPSALAYVQKRFDLDAVEFYPSLFGKRVMSFSESDAFSTLPEVSVDFLEKGVIQKSEASTIHQFGEGNLVRVIVPLDESGRLPGAVVISSYIPLSLISKMNDVNEVYQEFRSVNLLEYPLKSIYVSILFLMTLVILFAAIWLGFYIAQQLAIPIVKLGHATQRVAQGFYEPLLVMSGSEEITTLISNFNSMTEKIAGSEKVLREHNKYIEVVLGNVSAGVISVDQSGKITTINRHAADLLKLDPSKFIGRSVRDLLTLEYFRKFSELLKTMQEHKIESIQREMTIQVQGQLLPLLMNLSILKNDIGQEIGKILVFDDLTPIMNAQRAQAWTEVARRIAHEIKNPLTPIKLSAERLQRKFGADIKDPAFEESTTMIIRQVDDLKNLVNEFSQFARLPQAKPVEGDLSDTLQQVFSIFKNSHAHVIFELKTDGPLPKLKFDPDQIKRVFVNLIDNSIAALEGAFQPRIQVEIQHHREINLLRVTVSDNGPGIPSHNRQRIFEPYFSTKEKGTGLGLSIVKRIIEDHNGFIRALANEPHGTKMLIELPVNETKAWSP